MRLRGSCVEKYPTFPKLESTTQGRVYEKIGLTVIAFLDSNSGVTYWIFLNTQATSAISFQVKARHSFTNDDAVIDAMKIKLE